MITADKAWARDLEHIFKYGDKSAPRGMPIVESLGFSSVISMNSPIIRNPIRRLGYKFMAAEAAWILSGKNDVASIKPFSKEISKFSDDGETFFGAYGPKVYEQLTYVISILSQDRDSRQAVINIWRESPPVSKDIPCTLSLQFLIRNHALHCVASMRSSDLWLGHPYDIFNFSAISNAVRIELGKIFHERNEMPLVLGDLYLTAGSKHIYERNFEGVNEVLEDFDKNGVTKEASDDPVFGIYHDAAEFIDALWQAAESDEGALSLRKK